MNDSPSNPLAALTRRHFFSRCGMGLGSIALASLMDRAQLLGAGQASHPLAPKPTQFPARAKNVIYLFMAGGPSQLDLFDHKPRLNALNGQPIPDSYLEGKRFAFMDSSFKNKSTLLGTKRAFRQHGQSGMWVSELFPHTAGIVDDVSFVRTVATNVFNHAPAKLFMNTGSAQFGRPSMGAWVTYGIGSAADNLPGFVVLQSGPRGPRGGAVNWGSGFLPTSYHQPHHAGRHQRRTPAARHRGGEGPEPSAPRRDRRPGDRHAHRRLRDGLPDADQRARGD
jgi:hypothetical protein